MAKESLILLSACFNHARIDQRITLPAGFPMPSRFPLSSRAAFCALLTLTACVADEPAAPRHSELDKGALVRLADRLQSQGDNAMAAAFYERAITLDEKNVAAYYGLAKLQQMIGDPAAAERTFREALRYDSDNAAILRDYAKLRLTQGDAAGAAQHYRAALAVDRRDSKAINGLGVSLDQLGEHATAQDHYRTALAQNADDMTAINNLGLSLLMSGDAVGAAAVLAPAAESFKGTDSIRKNLALALSKTREQQKYGALSQTGQLGVPATSPAASSQPPAVLSALTSRQAPVEMRPSQLSLPVALPQPVPPPSLSALPAPPAPTETVSPLSSAGISLSEPPPAIASSPTTPKSVAKAAPEAAAILANKQPVIPTTNGTRVAVIPAQPIIPMALEPTPTPSIMPPVMLAVAEPVSASLLPVQTTPSRQLWKLRRSQAVSPANAFALPNGTQSAVFGPYATDAVAVRYQTLVQRQLHDAMPAHPVMNLVTTMNPDGTPQFRIRLYGFSDSDAVSDFCTTARAQSLPCSNP